MKNQYIIIVAGGKGSRMKSDIPKQFIEINGEPIMIKTIKKFLFYFSEIKIIVVVHKDYFNLLETLIQNAKINSQNIEITRGGDTRFDSVKNGLKLIKDNEAIVGIHDAARPFVSVNTIKSCYETAAKKGNAIPCLSIHESLRQVIENKNQIANRDAFKIIQTPQCFLVSKIKKAFNQAYQPVFTDDASVLETTGEKINLVEGNVENIKITSPFDLVIAKAILENEQ